MATFKTLLTAIPLIAAILPGAVHALPTVPEEHPATRTAAISTVSSAPEFTKAVATETVTFPAEEFTNTPVPDSVVPSLTTYTTIIDDGAVTEEVVSALTTAAPPMPVLMDGSEMSIEDLADIRAAQVWEWACNKVEDSEIVNQTSEDGSPLQDDCWQIARNIWYGGRWTINAGKQRQLAQYGSCAFGVEGFGGFDGFRVSNADIIERIAKSNQLVSFKRPSDGKRIVGAKGTMSCVIIGAKHEPKSIKVDWGLYHD